MNKVILAIVLTLGVNATAQKQPSTERSKPGSPVEIQIRGLEEKLVRQQFEIDQLKKELLVRDEEIHALMELIQEEENERTQDPSNDFAFEPRSAACHAIRYVQSFSEGNNPARLHRILRHQLATN